MKQYLSQLDMELTERCNNNCIHCYINLPQNDLKTRKKELTTDEIKSILKEAAALGCITVRFTGGEPFLREDFEELYIFARKQGLKILLFTNATLITPHLADLFTRIPSLEKIEVTIYGMKKESYEAVTRINGSFEASGRGINLLLEKKIPFAVKGVLLPSNRNEIEIFEKWALNIPWMNKPPAYSMFFNLHCRHNINKNKLIKKLRISPQEGLKILTLQKNKYIKEMKEFCSKFMGVAGNKIFSCGSGIGSGCIDAYGNFQPCLMLKHPDTIYNLKKGSLKDALTNFFPKVREITAGNNAYLNRCAKCFLKGLCEQCPAKSYMEHKTLDKPVKYLCEIAHAQARFLGLIKEKEKAWQVRNWKERIKEFSESAS
ncbi:MAG: radical SAM protein [Candidatus Omnitrophota bacterium]